MKRRNLLVHFGLSSLIAAVVLLGRVRIEATTALFSVGGTAYMVFFLTVFMSHQERKWVRVRKGLKVSTALLVTSTITLVAGTSLLLLLNSSTLGGEMITIALVIFLSGIVAELLSLTAALATR